MIPRLDVLQIDNLATVLRQAGIPDHVEVELGTVPDTGRPFAAVPGFARFVCDGPLWVRTN